MFGESGSIKPEEDKRPAGVSPRGWPRSPRTPTRISMSPFSSTTVRTPGRLWKALRKGSESNNSRQCSFARKEVSVQEGTGRQSNLVNLNETDLHLEEPWQDLRGIDVYDINDDQIGAVEDVYVDREQREAFFPDSGNRKENPLG
jgi:hypothetical protein